MMGLKTVVAAMAVMVGCLGGNTALAASHHGGTAHAGGHRGAPSAPRQAGRPLGAKPLPARHAAAHGGAKAGVHTGKSVRTGHRVAAGARPAATRAPSTQGPRAGVGVSRTAKGKVARSPQAKAAFKKTHPCPSTGRASGSCPGYVIDHVVPLKRGGADRPSNMQWQTTAAAKAKDKRE